MIPKRVFCWADNEVATDSERDLLAQYRAEIEQLILSRGSDDAEMVAPGQFLTNLPKPIIGRVMASWIFQNDEEAMITGIRTGDAFESPMDEE